MEKFIKKDYIRYEISKNNSIYIREKRLGRQITAAGNDAIEFMSEILGDTRHTDQNGLPMWFAR